MLSASCLGASEEEQAALLSAIHEQQYCMQVNLSCDEGSAWRMVDEAADGGLRPEAVRAGLARSFGLEPPVAALLLEAALLDLDAYARRDDEDTSGVETARTRAQAGLEAASRLAPDNREVALELASFYDRWANRQPGLAAELADLLLAAPRAWDLASALDERTDFLARVEVMAHYLARHPGHPLLLAEQAKGLDLENERASALAAAAESLAAEREPPLDLAAYLLGERVASLLELGLLGRALELVDLAPPPVRKKLLESGAIETRATAGWFAFHGTSRDPRLELTLAYRLAGRLDEAAILSKALRQGRRGPTPGDEDEPYREAERRITLDFFARLWSGEGGDPFASFAEAIGARQSEVHLDTPVERLALAAIAERELYPAFERYFLANACHLLVREAEDAQAVPTPHLAPAIRAGADRLGEAQRQAITDLGARIALLAGEPAAVLAGGCSPPEPFSGHRATGAAARYRLELLAPEEESLPVQLSFSFEEDEETDSTGEPFLGDGFPSRFEAVAWWRRGSEIGAVALGHASSPNWSAYWFTRSFDGGAHWSPPVFTGLAASEPYLPVGRSTLTGIVGDELRLEVLVPEVDLERVSNRLRVRPGLLAIPLAGMTADRDGDGLTDLLEERLTTDPGRADTDGDGLRDDRDPMPQLAARDEAGEPPVEAEAFLAAWFALGPPLPASERDGVRTDESGIPGAPTFAVGPGLPWHVLSVAPWLIVLPEGTAAEPDGLWSGQQSFVVRLFALNRDRDRAVVHWNGALNQSPKELVLGPEGWR